MWGLGKQGYQCDVSDAQEYGGALHRMCAFHALCVTPYVTLCRVGMNEVDYVPGGQYLPVCMYCGISELGHLLCRQVSSCTVTTRNHSQTLDCMALLSGLHAGSSQTVPWQGACFMPG